MCFLSQTFQFLYFLHLIPLEITSIHCDLDPIGKALRKGKCSAYVKETVTTPKPI